MRCSLAWWARWRLPTTHSSPPTCNARCASVNICQATASPIARCSWNGGLVSTRPTEPSASAPGPSNRPLPSTNVVSRSSPRLARQVASAEAMARAESSTKITEASGFSSAANVPSTPLPQPRSTIVSGPSVSGRWSRSSAVPWSRREAANTPGQLVTSCAPGSSRNVVGQSHGPGSMVGSGRHSMTLARRWARLVVVGPRTRSNTARVDVCRCLTISAPTTTDPASSSGRTDRSRCSSSARLRGGRTTSREIGSSSSSSGVQTRTAAPSTPCRPRFSLMATAEQYESTTTVGDRSASGTVSAPNASWSTTVASPGAIDCQAASTPGSTPARRCSSSSSAASQARSSSRSRSGWRRSS